MVLDKRNFFSPTGLVIVAEVCLNLSHYFVLLSGTYFENEYSPDEYGAEIGPNAQVWQIYLDETEQYDVEMIEGFRDTTDVGFSYIIYLASS